MRRSVGAAIAGQTVTYLDSLMHCLRFAGVVRTGLLVCVFLYPSISWSGEKDEAPSGQSAAAATQVSSGEDASSPNAESVRPGINKRFLDPDMNVDEWVERFEVESREVVAAREEIVEELGLSRGDRVADIGAGTGLFLAPFAREVGERGKVYALDIAPKFVERIETLADHKSLDQVEAIVCGERDVRLPPSSIDAAFVCDVYHHFEYPADSLRSIYKALRPGGQLVVIDFERIPGVSDEWMLGHVRAGKEVFRQEIENAGFEFVEEVELEDLKDNYFLRFRRPSEDQG